MEFDKTRKAIGVNNLNAGDRKDLLGKFTDAGGKVLSERSLKDESADEKGGKGGSGKKGGAGSPESRLPSEIARERRRQELEQNAQLKKALEKEEKEVSGFMSRFMIRLKCKLSGVAHFSEDLVTPGFLSRLNLDTKRALMEANITGNDLFSLNPEIGKTITKELDKTNPILVEIIKRAAELYDRSEMADLTSVYSSNQDTPVMLPVIETALKNLLRKLYYLKPYQETYLTAVDKAFDIQQSLEKKQSALYLSKKKKLRSDWTNLMNEIYPSLVLLFQRSLMKQVEPGTRLFEHYLDVDHNDKIGSRIKGMENDFKEESETAEDQSQDEDAPDNDNTMVEEEEEEDILLIRPDLSRGFEIMRSMTPGILRKKYDKKNEFAHISDKDKVLLSYLFFREFDDEYAFIMSSPKIMLNAGIYRAGDRVDVRRKFQNISDNIRPVYEMFHKYLHDYEELVKAQNNNNSSNYVEHARRIENLEGRRGATGREVRVRIKEMMGQLSGILTIVEEDMRNDKKIVQNPDDIIKFDSQLESHKLMNGRTVKDCLIEAYAYAKALNYRLEHGDLFGGVIELSDDEFEKAFPTRSNLEEPAQKKEQPEDVSEPPIDIE